MNRRQNLIAVMAATALAAGAAACGDDGHRVELASDDSIAVESHGPPGRADGHESEDGHGPGGGYGRHADESATEPESETAPNGEAQVDDPLDVVADLTDADIAGLLWMREEEQLAHDVYVALGEEWGVRVFENIAASELGHIERVTDLLERYGIDDPMAGEPAGSFTIPEMQALHDDLVADGLASLVDALRAGALIEEMDIADLRDRAAATDVAEISEAYAKLEQGSRNHLRAFTAQLEAHGVTYEPTVLDASVYDEIVSSAKERGRAGRGRRDH